MKNSTFEIIEVNDGAIKSQYTRAILENLPEWFGNKIVIDEYVEKVSKLPYWAALNQDDRCIGFFAVKTHYGSVGDIYVCGVLPEYQNKGIGKKIYDLAEKHFIQNGCKYMMVKTLSEKARYEPYERTRKFYEGIGFEPLVTLTEMWDEENPCLIMIKKL